MHSCKCASGQASGFQAIELKRSSRQPVAWGRSGLRRSKWRPDSKPKGFENHREGVPSIINRSIDMKGGSQINGGSNRGFGSAASCLWYINHITGQNRSRVNGFDHQSRKPRRVVPYFRWQPRVPQSHTHTNSIQR